MHELALKNELLLKTPDWQHPMGATLRESPFNKPCTPPKAKVIHTVNAVSNKSVNAVIRHHLHSFRSKAKETSHHRI